jgi:hypothetical protein
MSARRALAVSLLAAVLAPAPRAHAQPDRAAADSVPDTEKISPPIAGDVCADKQPHTFRLAENRDRLFASLAREKGVEPCALWASLSQAERDIFEMVTAYLGSCESRLQPPPSASDETALDHAQTLYSVNGPGLADVFTPPVPSGGGICGGYDSNRVFIGFDAAIVPDMRASHEKFGEPWGGPLNPRHVVGYNWWRASNDPGGPHVPFTERDMICWGGLLPCWVRIANSEGPTWHFFAKDGDLDSVKDKLWQRRGVCGVTDPHLVELTIGFNWDHESDPLCNPNWTKEIIKRIGPANFHTYKPTGADGRECAPTAPFARARDAKGELPHAGLGPDVKDGTCPPSAK